MHAHESAARGTTFQQHLSSKNKGKSAIEKKGQRKRDIERVQLKNEYKWTMKVK